MKKMKLIVMAMLLACTTSSFAQDTTPWKGVRVSYDYTMASIDYEGADDKNFNGATVSYVHAFNIVKNMPLFVETGAGLSFASYSDSEEGEGYKEEWSTNLFSAKIPVNLVYKFNINDQFTLRPYTGFYLRANISGKEKTEWSGEGDSGDESSNLFDEDDMGKDGTWNRFQFGWQIGTTLDYKQYNIGINYGLDFNEIAEKTKTSSLSVVFGYNF